MGENSTSGANTGGVGSSSPYVVRNLGQPGQDKGLAQQSVRNPFKQASQASYTSVSGVKPGTVVLGSGHNSITTTMGTATSSAQSSKPAVRKVISKEQYAALVGLITLAQKHYRKIKMIEEAAQEITGEKDQFGHTADLVWEGAGDNSDDAATKATEELIDRLNIGVTK